MSNLRVIGIDPGTITCGYGILEKDPRNNIIYIDSGTLRLSRNRSLPERLESLYNGVNRLLKEFKPREAAIEKVFFSLSINAALGLGHARGVVLLALASEKISIKEYSPNEVKKSVTGYGRAEKRQVQQMVKTILDLKHTPPSDSADALALAICHLNTMRL
ncbi:MAG: crossover junction endodeoxyribonuclease RuvC [Nitrospirae bacterium]|nr:crossover junction endodeoxyribonuclease RuvC [Nitrospirota bacterium]